MFSPVTTAPTIDVTEDLPPVRGTLSSLQLSDFEVTNVLENLDPKKASGPDEILGTLLKYTANET